KTNENLQAKEDIASSYTSIINVIYSAMTKLTFNKESDKTKLIAQLGFNDQGNFNIDNVGMCNLTNIPHYYTTGDVEIVYNSNVKLNVVEFCFFNNTLHKYYIANGENNQNPTPSNVGTDYWTTIYLVYDLEGTIRIEFFAVTKVPRTNALLEGNLLYENEKSNNSISTILFTRNSTNYTLTNSEINDSDIVLIWNKVANNTSEYWYNQGNTIFVKDKYGVDTQYDELSYKVHSTRDGKTYLTSTIVGSGAHNLVFSDLAGNTHEFASNTYAPQSYYMLYLIDAVIYHINYNEKDYNPIQYGVFNDELTLVVEKEYTHNYSNYEVSVSRNGNTYTDYEEIDKYTLKFNESGRYVVRIDALYGPGQTSLNPIIYNFTILNSDSARLAYEFVEIPGYEILQVIKNNQDITHQLKTNNQGKITSLFVSSTEYGNGLYTVTLKYGKRDTDTLTYSFSINNYIPTIACNVSHGETTTGSIVIYYNPSTIYEQLGECYIKVLTYNSDSKSFNRYVTIYILENSITSSGAKSFEITRSNSYFIQVETKSGNTLSSFRVNKKDPLNAVAILIIVAAVVAVIVLIIVVVKLRTRMKIK
ncbi:MAG: hypothetical protein IKA31_01640, partial [Clostridia bacterium]|nr:hypothetical protein [Clostridia bacterium]